MDELVQQLELRGVLKSKSIRTAFLKTDRIDFAGSQNRAVVYEDRPLSIGFGQTISQPTTVALMLELLEVHEHERVLDVGIGSGWTTALLANLVGYDGRVVGTEIVPELVELAKKNLMKYDYPQIEIHTAGDQLGWAIEAPYDRILVSAAAQQLPVELVQQLRSPGIMVIPIGSELVKVTKLASDELTIERHPGFAFVPLIEK